MLVILYISHNALYRINTNRLTVLYNWVLRGIFGPKRDEVTGEWRKLHNEELHDLYSSPNIVKKSKVVPLQA
jgi:hypothetical protein